MTTTQREILTPDALLALIVGDEARDGVQAFLDQGLGVAVYQNVDLGHPFQGHRKFLSYGGPESTVPSADLLPARLPDIGGEINWPYYLEGYCLPRGVEDEG